MPRWWPSRCAPGSSADCRSPHDELDESGGRSGTSPERTPLLRPADGLPPVVETGPLLRTARRSPRGSGPVAVDAERASGYRYCQRAYLVQLRRAGAGTALIDPIALPATCPSSHRP